LRHDRGTVQRPRLKSLVQYRRALAVAQALVLVQREQERRRRNGMEKARKRS
jgi:hypothetical protein